MFILIMKKRVSIKPFCKKCKILKRNKKLKVICIKKKHKQSQK